MPDSRVVSHDRAESELDKQGKNTGRRHRRYGRYGRVGLQENFCGKRSAHVAHVPSARLAAIGIHRPHLRSVSHRLAQQARKTLCFLELSRASASVHWTFRLQSFAPVSLSSTHLSKSVRFQSKRYFRRSLATLLPTFVCTQQFSSKNCETRPGTFNFSAFSVVRLVNAGSSTLFKKFRHKNCGGLNLLAISAESASQNLLGFKLSVKVFREN